MEFGVIYCIKSMGLDGGYVPCIWHLAYVAVIGETELAAITYTNY